MRESNCPVAKPWLSIMICFTTLFFNSLGCQRTAELQSVHGQLVSHWLDELKKPDPKARKKAITALEGVGTADPAAIPAIIGALRDSDPSVRDVAVLTLLNIGPDVHDAATAPEGLINDKDANIRAHATKSALNEFGLEATDRIENAMQT